MPQNVGNKKHLFSKDYFFGMSYDQTAEEWTVPQMSIIIMYNSTWSILIQKIRIKLSGDNLT